MVIDSGGSESGAERGGLTWRNNGSQKVIEELYRKRFGRARPVRVLSIEEHVRQQARKKAEKREAKLRRRQEAAADASADAGWAGDPS